ncbi:Cytochrome c oxidase subunit 6A, mitochondrial [Grifola frondosa]|uniref:Cytochrome c oxidase subunit 6A, mitochondrial n=1 Tax=Grifola frondosa TaxID=5627 RepID=A0A1C7MRU1_GRIFR|nr:Cytochrome c oxidase subunit 6A, mitochondrial [Grifola frondosa]
MSMLARRVLLRAVPRRGFATAAETEFAKKEAVHKAHAAEAAALWRRVSFFVCVPAIAVATLWVRGVEHEHNEHLAHQMAENNGHLPEPPAYEYLNRRARGPFPWGPNSLFFNSHTNKDMSNVE